MPKKIVSSTQRALRGAPVRTKIVKNYYDNGVLMYKGRLRGDKMHGKWEWFRRDATLMRTGEFALGKQTGIWRTFDRTGRLVKETNLTKTKKTRLPRKKSQAKS